MKIQRFEIDRHLQVLSHWLKLRESTSVEKDSIPEYGFVAYFGDTPVATAFLRRVEGGYGQLDGLTTNPECPSLSRHLGICKVVDAVVKQAKELKLKGLLAFTVSEEVLKRSKNQGFIETKHTVIVHKLYTV